MREFGASEGTREKLRAEPQSSIKTEAKKQKVEMLFRTIASGNSLVGGAIRTQAWT